SKRACAVLTLWISRFSDAPAEGFLFPRHMVGLGGDRRETVLYEIDFNRMGAEWKSAWKAVCQSTGRRYRWHDLRHTFVSRLAEKSRRLGADYHGVGRPRLEVDARSLLTHSPSGQAGCYRRTRSRTDGHEIRRF